MKNGVWQLIQCLFDWHNLDDLSNNQPVAMPNLEVRDCGKKYERRGLLPSLSCIGIGSAGYAMLRVDDVATGALVYDGVAGTTLADYIIGKM